MNLKNLRALFEEQGQGQDVIEYTLIIAFVALLASTVFIAAGGATVNNWTISNSHLASANAIASGTGTAAASTPPSSPSAPYDGGQGNHHDGNQNRDNH